MRGASVVFVYEQRLDVGVQDVGNRRIDPVGIGILVGFQLLRAYIQVNLHYLNKRMQKTYDTAVPLPREDFKCIDLDRLGQDAIGLDDGAFVALNAEPIRRNGRGVDDPQTVTFAAFDLELVVVVELHSVVVCRSGIVFAFSIDSTRVGDPENRRDILGQARLHI
jgi:hypothetical protein